MKSKQKKIIRINILMLSIFMVVCLLCTLMSNTNIVDIIKKADLLKQDGEIGSFGIRLKARYENMGSVTIDWKDYNYTNKNFKVYKSSDGSSYETVGIDYSLVSKIEVLNVYDPSYIGSDQLKSWMETNGYGKGIIKVTQVDIDDFNANPYMYMSKTGTNTADWKYDVLFFGNNDNGFDLNATSLPVVESFIKSGRGVICGHDIMVQNCGGVAHPYFWQLVNYFGISSEQYSHGPDATRSGKVKINKQGIITTHPWNIEVDEGILEIPESHVNGQVVTTGTNWLSFIDTPNTYDSNYLSYLVTYNNCAIIQTGHSYGEATNDEQKIIANLIFYMNQLNKNTFTTKDSSALDFEKPNKPDIVQTETYFNFSATDNGTKYWYYVESFDSDNTTETGLIDRSETKTIEVETGIKKYKYVLDNNPNTVITDIVGIETEDESIPYTDEFAYIHVAAIDGAGNIGETSTQGINNQHEVVFKNEGEVIFIQIVEHGKNASAPNLNKAGYTLSWDKDYTNIQYDMEINAVWTPNPDTPYKIEYYLQNKDMGVETYQLGQTENKTGTTDTTVTLARQDIKEIEGFEFNETNRNNVITGTINGNGSTVLKLYYTRKTYTITYKLNGGQISNPPYTYLYGTEITLPTIVTKDGYVFAGWYEDSNFSGEKVTKITETRAGNITLYAKWEENNGLKGDLNLDGKVTLIDLSLMNQAIVGKLTLTGQPKLNADINNDNRITLIDLSLINQIIVGKIVL